MANNMATMKYKKETVYTPRKRMVIGGIDALVVDPHNEVLHLWYTLANRPAIVVHIDAHEDMSSGLKPFEHFQSGKSNYPGMPKTFEEYVDNYLHDCTFIAPAVHDGIVKAVYHINPRDNSIVSFGGHQNGEFVNPLTTYIAWCGGAYMDLSTVHCADRSLTEKQFIKDLQNPGVPIILDIDLDGFNLKGADPPESIHHPERIDYVAGILSKIARPEMITIARSQTPDCYVYPKLVDQLESECIEMLEQVYK